MHDFSSTRENSEAIRAIDRIFTDITKFEIAIFGLHEENILENNTFDFFGLVSDSLRKMKLSIMKKRSLDSIDNYFFHTILNGIINLVWKPYACEITVWTSKGIAKERAVNNAKRLKREVLVSFDNELSILRKMQKRSGLDLNWEEIKEYDALNKNVDVDRNLARLIDLYDSVGA